MASEIDGICGDIGGKDAHRKRPNLLAEQIGHQDGQAVRFLTSGAAGGPKAELPPLARLSYHRR